MPQVPPRNRAERRHPELAELLDYEGAAQLLGTTARHVRKLAELREIASVKVGALVRFHPDDVAAYVNKRRRQAVS
jgi:excisionase family DNA binding protein